MNIPILVVLIILAVLATVWAVYNFYWLNKPQIFLLYKDGGITYNATEAQSLASQLGVAMASVSQVRDAVAENASVCIYGYATCGGVKDPACGTSDVVQAVLPLNVVGVTGATTACGQTPGLNGNGINGSGYWFYGSKPASVEGWKVAPYHAPIGPDTTKIGNKFEILGIPKVL